LFGFCLTKVQAQQATTAAGGSAMGIGGTVSYSIGQVVYTTNTGTSGSVAQGVQQPYITSTVLGGDEQQMSLNLQVYPNPTSDYLTLSVDNFQLSTLNYQLYNISGKLIESKAIARRAQIIRMESLAISTYFLKVTKNNSVVKIFKIIKN